MLIKVEVHPGFCEHRNQVVYQRFVVCLQVLVPSINGDAIVSSKDPLNVILVAHLEELCVFLISYFPIDLELQPHGLSVI